MLPLVLVHSCRFALYSIVVEAMRISENCYLHIVHNNKCNVCEERERDKESVDAHEPVSLYGSIESRSHI